MRFKFIIKWRVKKGNVVRNQGTLKLKHIYVSFNESSVALAKIRFTLQFQINQFLMVFVFQKHKNFRLLLLHGAEFVTLLMVSTCVPTGNPGTRLGNYYPVPSCFAKAAQLLCEHIVSDRDLQEIRCSIGLKMKKYQEPKRNFLIFLAEYRCCY